jgi:hypothetical protein
MTARNHDVARFEAGDRPEIVEASFCCRLCLRKAALVIVDAGVDDGHAWAFCAECRTHTEVALRADQVVRLTIAPPRRVPIHLMAVDEP